jgi:hypothetical protein
MNNQYYKVAVPCSSLIKESAIENCFSAAAGSFLPLIPYTALGQLQEALELQRVSIVFIFKGTKFYKEQRL